MSSSLALRAPPSAGRGPKNLGEFIARMQAQPGGFRAINQDELRARIAAKQRGDAEDEDEDTEDADDDADRKAPTIRELLGTRDEMFMNAEIAHQQGLFALDFISLLLSKQNPAFARETLSPGLRDLVGIGTLGTTILENPTTLMQERVAEFKEMEMGRRLLDLQSMASNLSAAAERLTKEIGLEERYWAEVIQVAAGGWSIFRMAQQPHTMGVKFGFPSATWPEARYNSTAPLGRADDGSVQLQLGKLAGSSKRLQVTITENSRIVGQSSLPAALGPDAPLGERVKEARDSVFAHELWHELNRECRRLLPLGVSLEQDAIVYQMDEQRVMSFQLADLEESDVDNPGLVAQENDLAESMVIIPQILLSQAHKQLVRKRGEAKRRNDDKSSARGHTSTARGSSPPFKLLEPIVTHMKHEQSLRFCTHLFSELTAVLQSAGIQAASCTMVEPLFAPLATARDAAASPADSLVQTLLVPPVVQLDITLTPETRIRVHADPSPLFGTRYLISLLPPRDAPTAGDAATRQAQEALSNPLLDLFPSLVPGEPSPAYAVIGQADAHYSQDNLVWYVENALPRALAARYMGMVQRQEATDSEPDDGWVLRIDRAGICNRETEQYGVSFNVVTNGGNTELQAVAILPQDGTTQTVEWSWTAEGGRQDQQPTLDEVVQKVLGSKLVPAQCA